MGGTKVMEDKSDFSVGTKQNQGLICRLISREIFTKAVSTWSSLQPSTSIVYIDSCSLISIDR